MIELDFETIFFKNKVIYYSDSIFDIEGYTSISFKAIKNKYNIPLSNCREEINYTIDLTQSLDLIWSNMDRNSRRNVKKAEQNGITIKFNQGYKEFYKMYRDHIQSKQHIKWPNIHKLDDIKKYGTLIIAEYNNKIISGSVFLEDEDNIVYWITASYRYSPDNEIKQLSGNATHLIQWEIIKYAKLKGLKEYNLGPCAYEDNVNYSLKNFKESLGSKPHTYYSFHKDYDVSYKIIRNSYRKIYYNRKSEL